MAEGESKSESKSEPVYEAFLEIKRYPCSEIYNVVFHRHKPARDEDFLVRRDLWDFENKGIFLPPREREEIAAEARRRGANVVVQSQSERYGHPYIFLRLDDERFLNKIGSWALRF